MKRKIWGVLTLFTALWFSTCGENLVSDVPGLPQDAKKETQDVVSNSSEQEKSTAVINEGGDNNPATEPEQEIEGMEPFNEGDFNTQRILWEAEHPKAYEFQQEHRRSRTALYSYASITVIDDIPDGVVWPFSLPDETGWEPFLLSDTISQLYEKIDALWTEERNESSAVLIKYDDQLHYPAAIQIKNIHDSGYDYLVQITVLALDSGEVDKTGDSWPPVFVPEPVLEPFDQTVFITRRAAWEAEHPEWYSIRQTHSGPPGIFLSGEITVLNDKPEHILWPGKINPDPWLRCNTISELYEKIDALWTEQHNTGAVFLIKYNDQRHYPTDIQIKNINGSGYDYKVSIKVAYDGDTETIMIGGEPPW